MKTPIAAAEISKMPMPGADALAHSEACAAHIRAEITKAKGWISFARFMELALYVPGLGYYAAGARKFGADGDFVTAPEISALFGQCIARSIAETIRTTSGNVLELGPGSGKLACDVLLELDLLGTLPKNYFLLEVSADLRERQTQALARLPSHLATLAVWLDALPVDFDGAMIANEVLDVVPVHLVSFSAGWVFERGVVVDEHNQFQWRDNPAIPKSLNKAVALIQATFQNSGADSSSPDDYLTEIAPAVEGLVASLAKSLRHGAILLIDYGFRQAEFYHPHRTTGTLMCHYRHYAHTDPFYLPGLQDITAHVDFTSVAETGIANGLALIGYTSQAQFLLQAGITDLIAAFDPADASAYLPITNQAQRLLSPAEMGEFFKVIGFGKGGSTIGALENARPLPLS